MPFIRVCYYCNNRFIASTYQMARHSEECRQKILTGHTLPIYLERGWKESQNDKEYNTKTVECNENGPNKKGN